MSRVKRLFTQFCKFGLVGTLCFCIDYGIMVLLTARFGIPYFASSAISFIISVIVNYVLSMRFVFKSKDDRSKWAEMTVFLVLSALGLGLNQMIMWIAVEFFQIFYALAKIFSTLLVTVYNFLSRKLFLEA
ncbi:MAG: GtrA family protein [Muribaculaceae bacterium]|nr:GtrA family protein [Roseburia sp.]MCM1431802.1 GtrA family protein [Muribaculaceae bacterium]MCM1493483.1 GtrA family protein [Muribaculaceae bacterium]